MDGEFDMEVIENMRQLARDNISIAEILEYLIKTLNLNSNSRLIVISYFREAFFLKIGEASRIGAWEFLLVGHGETEPFKMKSDRLLKRLLQPRIDVRQGKTGDKTGRKVTRVRFSCICRGSKWLSG